MVKGLQTTKYHLWFKGMVNGWIFMATERCKSKIKKAIAIDEVRDMCYCYCVCVCVCENLAHQAKYNCPLHRIVCLGQSQA